MLELKNISKSFAGPDGVVRAVDGVSVSAKAGEVVAVQGPSGCGKTTLLLAAGGLLKPTKGQVLIDGVDPYSLPGKKRSNLRGEKIGFVFQQFYLIPYLNVIDNICAGQVAGSCAGSKETASKLVERFNLVHRVKHFPQQLSVGERQRTALARALVNSPKILLADEPTGNLDEENAKTVLEHIRRFADEGGAVLLVSHDSTISKFCDRTIRLV